MAANLSGLFFYNALKTVFETGYIGTPITNVALYKGALPSSILQTPADTELLSTPSLGAAPGGTVNIPYETAWALPSSGVTMLSSALPLYIRSTGLPTSPIPGFLRFFNSSTPYLDIEVSAIKENKKAQISSMSAVTAGQVLALSDIRFKLATSGPLSFNNSLASAILRCLTTTIYLEKIISTSSSGYEFGYGSIQDPYVLGGGGFAAVPIIIEAYDGAIPASANDAPTGTKLWTQTYTDNNSISIWLISGNSLGLNYTFSANALASGTPTYLRIYKNQYNNPPMFVPKMVIQAPVGVGDGYAQFTANTFTAGQEVSLNSFTISFALA